MLKIRKSADRGISKNKWLDSKHSFSFGFYWDKKHMNFSDLRVINEDIIQPSSGFNSHRHNDMEIITYILSGCLEHKDNIRNGSIIVPGDVQRMSAGTGIIHSEFNPSEENLVHLLQIWITPSKLNIDPSYEQKNFTEKRKINQLTLLCSPDGREDSITISQDANIYVLDLLKDNSFEFAPSEQRKTWFQIVKGSCVINNLMLNQGDGLSAEFETKLEIMALDTCEILVFDLP